ISFAGLVFAGAVTTIASALLAGMALRVDDLGNNVTILWGIFDAVSAAAAIGLAIHIGAATTLGIRTKLFPQWINALGALAALANLVATLGLTSDSSGIFAFAFIGFFGWALWILALSVILWKREPAGNPVLSPS